MIVKGYIREIIAVLSKLPPNQLVEIEVKGWLASAYAETNADDSPSSSQFADRPASSSQFD